MDALSDMLRLVKLTGAVYFAADFSAPWCISADDEAAGGALPKSEHMIFFHLLTQGSCFARLPDGESVHFEAGDLIVLPHQDFHVMGSAPGLAPVPIDAFFVPPAAGQIARASLGGGGEVTRIVCGFLSLDKRLAGPLLDNLPRLIRVRVDRGEAAAWLASSVKLTLAEEASPRAGSGVMLAKLSELMFVEALRNYIEALPPEQTGWLAGLRDRYVGRALTLLHARPAEPWTVDSLAKEVALSRSALAQRFTDLLGTAPMQYLTRWRLQLAAQMLHSERRGVGAVASDVGYESEAAFNRAFKREFGSPPAAWRKAGAGGRRASSRRRLTSPA
ncbi:MAG TPA: AraC family transcriptional regulator [Burkholderiales bacterium]|nr:AraC family transcriptional regulator [Burkholderiales bacterium]